MQCSPLITIHLDSEDVRLGAKLLYDELRAWSEAMEALGV